MRDDAELRWSDPLRRSRKRTAGDVVPLDRARRRHFPDAQHRPPAPDPLPSRRPVLAAGLGLAVFASALALHLVLFHRAKRNLGF